MQRDKLQAALAVNKEERALHAFEEGRRRLADTIEKKLNTAFIGALARFETAFGHLWGHGKEVSELTTNQRDWRERWSQVRNEVLNNGNNQVRAMKQELDVYLIQWQGFLTVLKPKV